MTETKNEKKNETKKIFVPLTNDILFKDTYGNPRNIRLLESFIESKYKYPKGYLKDKLEVQYEVTLKKDKYKNKNIRGDLIVIVDKKLILNIEVYNHFNIRALRKSYTYVMRIYSTQLDNGESYKKAKKVEQINITNKTSENLKDIDREYYFGPREYADVKMEIINLDKIDEYSYNESDEFIRHLKFIRAKSEEERRKIAKGDKIMSETEKWLDEYYTKLEETLIPYREHMNIEIAREEGEERMQQEIAKNMLKENTDINFISKVTKLSIKEIEDLNKN